MSRQRVAARKILSTLCLALALATPAALGPAAPAGAVSSLTSFLVPGETRPAAVLADWPFELHGMGTDGLPDPRFGRGGTASAPFRGLADLRTFDAATLADGSIVLAGTVTRRRRGREATLVALARFSASGQPDPRFGRGGALVTRFKGRANAVAPQPRGALLVGGAQGTSGFLATIPILVRLRPDGSPDPRVGRHGLRGIRIGGAPAYAGPFEGAVTELAGLPGGGALAVVRGDFGGRSDLSFLLRLGPRGRPDRRFGLGGRVALAPGFGVGKTALRLPGIERGIYDLVARRDRLYLLARTATHAAVVALRPDGRVDRAFGEDGIALGPPSGMTGTNIGFTVDREGSAMLVVRDERSSWPSFLVARFSPDGHPAHFGGPGGGITPSLPGRPPYSARVLPGGDLQVLSFDPDPPHDPLVARFRFDSGSLGIWPGPGQS